MLERGYAQALRELRALEDRKRVSFLDRATEIYRLRITTIASSDLPIERKEALFMAADRQFRSFYGQEPPAQG